MFSKRVIILIAAFLAATGACGWFYIKDIPNIPSVISDGGANAPDLQAVAHCDASRETSFTQTNHAIFNVSADGNTTAGSLRAVSSLIINGVTTDLSDPNTDVRGASNDGAVAGGTTAITSPTSVQRAMRWTQATGWVPLGKPDGALSCDSLLNLVNAVSGSGQYLVGMTGTSAGPCMPRAYRWSQMNGWQILDGSNPIDRRDHTAAYAVSDDGSITAGAEYVGNSAQQRACYWDASGVFHPIGPAGVRSKAHGVSHNGKYIVGESSVDADGNGGAWLYSVADGTLQILGETLDAPGPGVARSAACFAVSDDGRTAACAHGPPRGNYQNAFIWKKGTALTKLDTYLVSKGIVLTGWDQFSTVRSMSADAAVFGGITATGLGYTGGFIAHLIPCETTGSTPDLAVPVQDLAVSLKCLNEPCSSSDQCKPELECISGACRYRRCTVDNNPCTALGMHCFHEYEPHGPTTPFGGCRIFRNEDCDHCSRICKEENRCLNNVCRPLPGEQPHQ